MSSPDLLARARALSADLIDIRRDLHRHPELSFQEVRTAGVVASALGSLGLDPRTGIGRTGVVADIVGGPGPVVALRADMDALPIHEDADHDYRSTVDGVMHACGHDAHTAGLIGAARLLVACRDEGSLTGTVRLLFQPSEETVDEEGKSGAMRMLEDGALDGVDAVVGLHVGGPLPSGRIFLAPGAIMGGGEEIVVEVRGRAAHAALPQDGIDAIVLAAQGVVAAQAAVSRCIAPTEPGLVTFGHVRGGQAANVIADRVVLRGTLRYFQPEVRDALRAAVRGAFEGLRAQGAEVDVVFRPGYPPVVNDPKATAVVNEALTAHIGRERVLSMSPVLLAEDFAFLAQTVPGVFLWLGAGLEDPRQHHHPRFDIDEAVLPLGAAALAHAALALIADGT
ncbi:MAG: amidohydrolase [Gemmatimonadetes bacterium]|nr:amidohydrolase [Gemmatimonadota bacterium]